MKTFNVFLFVAATVGASLAQDEETEGESGIETSLCVFGCLSSFERKGVVESGATTTVAPSESVCDRLDLEGFVTMCKSYEKADTCLRGCVNNPIKKIITSGLDYICIHRREDFNKYMGCFKTNCPLMEQQCGTKCGTLEKAEDRFFEQIGVNNKTETAARRKRDAGDPETDTSSDTGTPITDSSVPTEGSNGEIEADPIDTCQFVKCYVNCSRPMLEKDCGKDAYELLKQTSNILLSFVMAPLEEAWSGAANATLSDTMTTCDKFFSQALTDEGVDRQILKSGVGRPIYGCFWSILLFPVALALIFRL